MAGSLRSPALRLVTDIELGSLASAASPLRLNTATRTVSPFASHPAPSDSIWPSGREARYRLARDGLPRTAEEEPLAGRLRADDEVDARPRRRRAQVDDAVHLRARDEGARGRRHGARLRSPAARRHRARAAFELPRHASGRADLRQLHLTAVPCPGWAPRRAAAAL